MASQYKTPGVYIKEINAFPNSVVEVATAVPAFIGYTSKAKDDKGASLSNKPKRISSMSEFTTYFGDAPVDQFNVTSTQPSQPKPSLPSLAEATAMNNDAASQLAEIKKSDDAKSILYKLAVSSGAAGAITKTVGSQLTTDKVKSLKAKAEEPPQEVSATFTLDVPNALKQEELKNLEPDLISSKIALFKALAKATQTQAVKDAVNALATSPVAEKVTAANVAFATLNNVAEMLGKAITLGETAKDVLENQYMAAPIGTAVDALKAEQASPGAATVSTTLPASQNNNVDANPDFVFKNESGGEVSCWVNKTGNNYYLYYSMRLFFQNGGGDCYIVSVGNHSETVTSERLTKALDLLEKEQEPTIIVIPDAMALDKGTIGTLQQAMLTHCGSDMKNRFAILDVLPDVSNVTNSDDVTSDFRASIGTDNLAYGAAYYPWLNTSVVQVSDLSFDNFTFTGDKLDDDVKKVVDMIKDAKSIKTFQALKTLFAKPNPDRTDIAKLAQFRKLLPAVSTLYASILTAIASKLNLLPPSAAMAGVYARVDNSRGVWKAPANVSLNAVVAPALNFTKNQLDGLNVPTDGKAVNAIRTFIGQGTLVWGARTLDGISDDWRYINVRRTMIMLEESIRLAAGAYVFEPNTANTWANVKGMIRNFLTGIWQRGGLAGSSPDDAFGVYLGLGETMTGQDILDGYMLVTVLVALVRPAEFIEITFQQEMQKS